MEGDTPRDVLDDAADVDDAKQRDAGSRGQGQIIPDLSEHLWRQRKTRPLDVGGRTPSRHRLGDSNSRADSDADLYMTLDLQTRKFGTAQNHMHTYTTHKGGKKQNKPRHRNTKQRAFAPREIQKPPLDTTNLGTKPPLTPHFPLSLNVDPRSSSNEAPHRTRGSSPPFEG